MSVFRNALGFLTSFDELNSKCVKLNIFENIFLCCNPKYQGKCLHHQYHYVDGKKYFDCQTSKEESCCGRCGGATSHPLFASLYDQHNPSCQAKQAKCTRHSEEKVTCLSERN